MMGSLIAKEFEEAFFLKRPNRFTVICSKDPEENYIISAHLPNSGSLMELLLPKKRLIIKKEDIKNTNRKHPYTVWAAYKNDTIVLLHTIYSNKVIKELIDKQAIKCFEGYRCVAEEVKKGEHRFDLVIENKKNKKVFVEVKSCTLFDYNIAMFPDAVTLRGKNHIEQLSQIGGGVVFLIHSKDVDIFLPNFHTDPDFSETLYQNRKRLKITAVCVKWNKEIKYQFLKEVPVAWDLYKRYRTDKGSYMLVLELKHPKTINVGSLGHLSFPKGYYIYVGSGLSNLTQRIKRHLRKKKKRLHWHIDYLVAHSSSIKAFPIRSPDKIECDIAKMLNKHFESPILGFGSSDCLCDSHLFFSIKNPIQNLHFLRTLHYFRFKRLS